MRDARFGALVSSHPSSCPAASGRIHSFVDAAPPCPRCTKACGCWRAAGGGRAGGRRAAFSSLEPKPLVERRQIGAEDARVRVVGPQNLFGLARRLGEQRLRLLVTADRLVERGEVVDRCERVGVLRAEHGSPTVEGLDIEGLGLVETAGRLEQRAEVVDRRQRLRMVVALGVAPRAACLLEERLRFVKPARGTGRGSDLERQLGMRRGETRRGGARGGRGGEGLAADPELAPSLLAEQQPEIVDGRQCRRISIAELQPTGVERLCEENLRLGGPPLSV